MSPAATLLPEKTLLAPVSIKKEAEKPIPVSKKLTQLSDVLQIVRNLSGKNVLLDTESKVLETSKKLVQKISIEITTHYTPDTLTEALKNDLPDIHRTDTIFDQDRVVYNRKTLNPGAVFEVGPMEPDRNIAQLQVKLPEVNPKFIEATGMNQDDVYDTYLSAVNGLRSYLQTPRVYDSFTDKLDRRQWLTGVQDVMQQLDQASNIKNTGNIKKNKGYTAAFRYHWQDANQLRNISETKVLNALSLLLNTKAIDDPVSHRTTHIDQYIYPPGVQKLINDRLDTIYALRKTERSTLNPDDLDDRIFRVTDVAREIMCALAKYPPSK